MGSATSKDEFRQFSYNGSYNEICRGWNWVSLQCQQPDWSQLLDLSWPSFKSGTEWHRMTVLQRSDSGLESLSPGVAVCTAIKRGASVWLPQFTH